MAGQRVKVAGWVNTIRSHGKVIFVDLRDRSGILQLVFTPDNEKLYTNAQELRPEWVIGVEAAPSKNIVVSSICDKN